MNLLTKIFDVVNSAGFGNINMAAVFDWEEQLRFMGVKLINMSDFMDLAVRMSLNTILIFIVVHFIYAKNSKRQDFYFSFLAIGVIVFLISFLLSNVKLELGFALGLFAVFGILRYRTDAIPIKEMTYLFIVIGISVINALSNKKVSYAELVLANGVIVFGLWFLEKSLTKKQELSVRLIYEKIENINVTKESILLEDLKARTGINISRYEIVKIDSMRDSADLICYYPVNKTKNKLK